MPKSTFYRLAEEKKERILNAAKQEFFKLPYPEVSINKIIKSADIPRGSFYQYFEDKQDLFLYVISSQQEIVLDYLKNRLIQARGDFFQLVFTLLDQFEKLISTSEAEEFVSRFQDPESMRIVTGMITGEKIFSGMEMEIETMLLKNLDFSLLNVEEEDKRYFIHVSGAVIRDTLKHYFCGEEKIPTDQLCKEIRGRVTLLEKVFRKKN